MIGKTTIKQWTFKIVKPFIKTLGYTIVSLGGVPSVRKESNSIIHDEYIFFDSDDYLSFYIPSIRYKIIEENLLRITNNTEYNGSITIELKTDSIMEAFRKTPGLPLV